MQNVSDNQIAAFLDAAHRAGRYNLLRYSSGNLSCRAGDEKVLLSASRSWLGEIRADQVSLCRLSDEGLIEGPRPSVEARFHLGILRNRADVNVVFHFQSLAATTFACSDNPDRDYFVIPEIPFYIGKPAVVPYIQPGTEQLAQAVIDAAGNADMIILRNHGLVTVGKDYNDAMQKAGFFELACQLLLQPGQRVMLGPEDTEILLNHFTAKKKLFDKSAKV